MRKVLLFAFVLFIALSRLVYSQSAITFEARYAIGTVCITDPSQAPSWDSMTSYGTNNWWTFDPWSCDNCDMYVRLRFNIPAVLYGSIDKLDIEIRSDDGHTVWVNGQRVGSAGGGCHAGGTAQRTYNIKPYLQPGENEIVIWCSEAWGDEYCFFRIFWETFEINTNQVWYIVGTSYSSMVTIPEAVLNLSSVYVTLSNISEAVLSLSPTYTSLSTIPEAALNLSSVFVSSTLVYDNSNIEILSYSSNITGNLKITELLVRYRTVPEIPHIILLILYNTSEKTVLPYPTAPMLYINGSYVGNTTRYAFRPPYPDVFSIRVVDNYTDLRTAIFIVTHDPREYVVFRGIDVMLGRAIYVLGIASTQTTSRTIDFLYAIPIVVNLKDRARLYTKSPAALFYLNLETTGLKNIVDPTTICDRIYIMYYNPIMNRLERVPFFVDRFTCSAITTRIPIFVALPKLSEFSNLLYFVFITNETAELQNPTELFLFYADLSRTAYYANLRVLATQNVTYDILGGLYVRLRANDIFSIIIE